VDRLLNEGKLSLIVDLDQTLIHATVGPAIDEWINSQGGMPHVINECLFIHGSLALFGLFVLLRTQYDLTTYMLPSSVE
jgi:hypothetical protein